MRPDAKSKSAFANRVRRHFYAAQVQSRLQLAVSNPLPEYLTDPIHDACAEVIDP
jgi:hypothetical protein